MNSSEKIISLRKRKSRPPLCALTAYDFPTARLLDQAGIDILLVGDSLGMVVLGFPDTTHVTLAHMLHHTAAVARAQPAALILGDLPIHSYDSPQQALSSATLLIAAGADAVKLEGGRDQLEKIQAILAAGIAVIGHIGMLPQRVNEQGGYRKHGKTDEAAAALIDDARALEKAGVCALVLESIVPAVAAEITRAVAIPTIGIGCGESTCDGEVAVVTDLLGSYPWFVPPFAKPEVNLAAQIVAAAHAYRRRVQSEHI